MVVCHDLEPDSAPPPLESVHHSLTAQRSGFHRPPLSAKNACVQGRPPTELKTTDNGKSLSALGLQHGDMLLLS